MESVFAHVSRDCACMSGNCQRSSGPAENMAWPLQQRHSFLPPGTYRLRWFIDCDGENAIRLRSDNGAEIEPGVIPVHPGEFEGEAFFTIRDAADSFQIVTDFCGGTQIQIYDFILDSPVYHDHALTGLLAAVAFCILWWRYKIRKNTDNGWMVIALAVLYASVPSLKDNIIQVYDTPFHVARLWNLADGLRRVKIQRLDLIL